jgi:hypothetical protein
VYGGFSVLSFSEFRLGEVSRRLLSGATIELWTVGIGVGNNPLPYFSFLVLDDFGSVSTRDSLDTGVWLLALVDAFTPSRAPRRFRAGRAGV